VREKPYPIQASQYRRRDERAVASEVRLGPDVEQLAEELAERMREVVPSGIDVRAGKGMLWFKDFLWSAFHEQSPPISGSYACHVLNMEGDLDNRLVEACSHALDDLQDFVDENTGEPWPGQTTVPSPGACIQGSDVLLWYGNIDKPVLRLRPLRLDE